MSAVTLSRWTMSYFAVAIAFLLAAEIAMIAGIGYPSDAIGAPSTLIVVHMVAIGWLSLVMTGALFQFVPVLVARPLRLPKLTFPALLLITGGLLALLGGFFSLDHPLLAGHHCLAIGGGLMAIGFALAIVVLVRTLIGEGPLPLPARFVAAGLACLVATVTLGVIFSVTLSGLTFAGWAVALVTNAVPIHALMGLAGWLSFTAMGVSYRLLSMFMLAPELDRKSNRLLFIGGSAVLALALLIGSYHAIAETSGYAFLIAGLLAGLVLLGLYGRDVLELYRSRRRRKLELNSQSAAVALIAFGISALAIMGFLAGQRFDGAAVAAIYLFIFGWLSGLVLSQLYKIVPFLTWLECFGPVLGKMSAPRVQDLVRETNARWWFALYFGAVLAATAMLAVGAPQIFRAAVFVQFTGTAGILFEILRARRLYYAAGKFPADLPRPRLLLSTASSS